MLWGKSMSNQSLNLFHGQNINISKIISEVIHTFEIIMSMLGLKIDAEYIKDKR